MEIAFDSTQFLMLAVLLAASAGLALLTWGRRLPRNGDWLVGICLAALAGAVGASMASIAEQGFRAKVLLRGWVLPPGEAGSITVGILEDQVGLLMTGLSLAVGALLLSQRKAMAREPRIERVFSATCLSTAGLAVAWISATPWLALAGIALTVLGGFVALGSRWGSDQEATLASRFLKERSWGMLLTLLGVCGLIAFRPGTDWADAAAWASLPADRWSEELGAVLLVAGIFVQFHPFPFLSTLVASSEVSTTIRVVLIQLFPAWAAYALLIRLSPQLRALGVLSLLAWVQLASAVLALGAGLLQQYWRAGFHLWVSAGLSISVAVLAFSDSVTAVSLLVGIILGASVVASSASMLTSGTGGGAGTDRSAWVKAAGLFGMAAASGMVGFVSAGGGIGWISQNWGDPVRSGTFTFVLFLFALLGWKQALIILKISQKVDLGWGSVLSPFVLVILSLGIVWTGTITGGAVIGTFDQFFASPLQILLGSPQAVDEASFLSASGAYWGVFAVALAVAWWVSTKAPWKPRSPGLANLVATVAAGYGVDQLASRALGGVAWIGSAAVEWIDRKFWWTWVPVGADVGVRRLAEAASKADGFMTERLRIALTRSVEVPSKLLQLLQSGDVQWYLFFAIGSAVALLIHFLKF